VIGTGWKAAEMRIEYIVVRELFLNGGRVLSILFFLGIIHFVDIKQGMPYLLLILGAGHSVIYLFVKNIRVEHVASKKAAASKGKLKPT
jgi:YQGE family putative transporter